MNNGTEKQIELANKIKAQRLNDWADFVTCMASEDPRVAIANALIGKARLIDDATAWINGGDNTRVLFDVGAGAELVAFAAALGFDGRMVRNVMQCLDMHRRA